MSDTEQLEAAAERLSGLWIESLRRKIPAEELVDAGKAVLDAADGMDGEEITEVLDRHNLSDELQYLPIQQVVMPDDICAMAEHIELVMDKSLASKFESRAREFVLAGAEQVPDPYWTAVLGQFNGSLVALALALGMCTHEDE